MGYADIDIDSFKFAASVCETRVETDPGSGIYQNLFTCNIRLDTANNVKSNVETLLKGCRGILPEINGKTTLIIEQDSVVTPDEITTDQIVGDITIEESGTNNRYNRVIVTYIDKTQNWKKQEAIWPDNALHETLKTEDNDKLLEKKVTLNTCTNHNEAYQMARILCLLSRESLKSSIKCSPECIKYTVGDIVPISHPSPMWSSKPFRVIDVDVHKDGLVTLHVKEHQPYIYNWNGVIRSIPDVVTVDLKSVQSPTHLDLIALADSKLELSWQSNRANFIVNILNSNNVVVMHDEPNEKKYIIKNLVQGIYTAQVAAVSGIGYQSDWSVLQFNISLPSLPIVTADSISSDSITLSANVAGLPSLETTFFWQFLGAEEVPVQGAIVKGDIYTYIGLIASTTYKFKCKTVNIAGESDWVDVTAKTLAPLFDFDEMISIQEGILEQIPTINSRLDDVILDTTLNATKSQDNQVAIDEISNSITIESFATKEKDWEYVKSLLDKEVAVTDLVARNINFALAQTQFSTEVTDLFSRAEINTLALAAHNTQFSAVSDKILTLANDDTALANRTQSLEAKVDLANGETVTAIAQEIASAQVSYCSIGRHPSGAIVTNQTSCEAIGGTWIQNKPISELLHGAQVTNAAGQSVSAVSYLQALEDENGQLKARAFFGIDSDGKKGMVIYNDVSGDYERIVMNMVVDDFVLSKSSGAPVLYVDTQTNKMTFAGDLSAVGGTFTGDLSAVGGTFTGTVRAEKIIGDVVDAHLFSMPQQTITTNVAVILSFIVQPEVFDRILTLSSVFVEIAEGSNIAFTLWDGNTVKDATEAYGYHVGQKSYSGTLASFIPKSTTRQMYLKVQGDGLLAMIQTQKIVMSLFSQGTSITNVT